MTNQDAESFIIVLARSGTQAAAAAELGCSQAAIARRFKSARELLGGVRSLELIGEHQRDAACGITLRKPFIMNSGLCGVCGAVKTRQASGKLRCNACRSARYRATHPVSVTEPLLSPEDAAVKFLIMLATEGTQAATAKVLGVSKSVISDRLTKARRLLGDAAVIEVLKKHQRDEKCGHTLVKAFYLNSTECRKCGMPRTALATTGELVCQSCSNKRNREYKKRHADRVAAASAQYREENREALRQKNREYRAANPGIDAAYYRANAERIKASVMSYRAANKEKLQDYFRTYVQTPERREAGRARLRAWKKAHPDRVNADTARRQLILRQAYVPWADDELIAEAYALARLRSAVTGSPWEVDHIVPLNSDLVCGLHWEGNLQVIPAVANLAKSNDWWPDMPDAPAHVVAFAARPSMYLVVPARACLPAPAPVAANDEEVRHAHPVSRGGRA